MASAWGDREVRADDAATDALALALTLAARAVRLHALGEEEADALVAEDTLHHREALLVVAAGDLEDVALELVAERVRRDLRAAPLRSKTERILPGYNYPYETPLS